MPPLGHALLSPSSADRWIHCPPSAKENAEAPRVDTVYTREGTLAHELCEMKARREFLGLSDEEYDKAHAAIEANELYLPEMERCSDFYIECLKDYVLELGDPFIRLEQRVDLSKHVPGCYGTADCVITDGETVHIVDYKHGKGHEVSAIKNAQMMIYAVGVIDALEDMFEPTNVVVSIVQPRITHEVSSWEITVESLRKWRDDIVVPAAKLATTGEGEYTAGDWCCWCVNKGRCRAQLREFEELLTQHDDTLPNKLSPSELAHAIDVGSRLKAWIDAVNAHAIAACQRGEHVPGFKVVEGRSNRAFKDQNAAFERARANDIPDEMLYKRSPISLSDLEKLMGKKKFKDTMSDLVMKPAGNPTLVPDTDPREALKPTLSVEADFDNQGGN